MLIISGDGDDLDEMTLRRSGVLFWCCLDARNKEWGYCFSRFTADLQEIANDGSVNAVAGLGICKGFARNCALSNGPAGNPS